MIYYDSNENWEEGILKWLIPLEIEQDPWIDTWDFIDSLPEK